eukprot:TRINITY_DN3660_c0_g1_i1.p1 TRINITY_DN3660_c0_g1~~TRINITY_DN3660_c0_g1_i1.p1  ORF type:complete len:388 (-),score=94.14 TRINITY_DN3660_c0_g1_i1:482-1645(-)
MIRRPPRSTLSSSSAASDVYKRQVSTQSTGVVNRSMPSITLQVPRSKHRVIIGPRGSTIQSIQQEFGCNISIARDESDSVLLDAPDQSSLHGAHQKISEILGMQVDSDPLCVLELGVESSEFGRVIGSRGSTLKAIERDAGCVVLIPSDRNPDIKFLTLQGTASACAQGKLMVEDAVGRACAILGEHQAEDGLLAAKHVVTYLERSESQNKIVSIHETLMFPDKNPDVSIFNRFLDYLRSARKTLKACVFTLSDSSIMSVLVHLYEAGIEVRVITEDSTLLNSGSQIETLVNAGISVKVDKSPYLMHHKFAVMDSQCMLTGSFNWTREAATHNYENVIFTNNKDFVQTFEASFDEMWDGSDFESVTHENLSSLAASDFSHRPRHLPS